MAERVPIRGEAGIGYVLEGGFDMPPLMLTPDEIEAAMLGAQWVMTRADPVLTRAASDLIAKIGVVIPEHLRPLLMEPALQPLTSHKRPGRCHRHGARARRDPHPGQDRARLSRRERVARRDASSGRSRSAIGTRCG